MMFPLMIIIGVRIVKATLKHVKMLRKSHLNIPLIMTGSTANKNAKRYLNSRTSENKKQSKMEREKHATIATETLKVVGTATLNKLLSKKTFIANNACS